MSVKQKPVKAIHSIPWLSPAVRGQPEGPGVSCDRLVWLLGFWLCVKLTGCNLSTGTHYNTGKILTVLHEEYNPKLVCIYSDVISPCTVVPSGGDTSQ